MKATRLQSEPVKLKTGGYRLRYTPVEKVLEILHYDGTLRVTRPDDKQVGEDQVTDSADKDAKGNDDGVRVSADLYVHRSPADHPGKPEFPDDDAPMPEYSVDGVGPQKKEAPAIVPPIFPHGEYRYYFKSTDVLEGIPQSKEITIHFSVQRFDHVEKAFQSPGTLTVVLSKAERPEPPEGKTPEDWGPADGDDYWEGQVINDGTGMVVGTLEMGWISNYLRSAVLELDKVRGAEFPANNGKGKDWKKVFDEIHWALILQPSNTTISAPHKSGVWDQTELHHEMLKSRRVANLDKEWRYHLLCVNEIEGDGYERGVMYDANATDVNDMPREGAAVTYKWPFPGSPVEEDATGKKEGKQTEPATDKEDRKWGCAAGQPIGKTSAYFRTAVHEIGHAMGLDHNWEGNYFMNTTDVIAENSLEGEKAFPDNIGWKFAKADVDHLQHAPDVAVRPGTGVDKQSFQRDAQVKKAEGLELHVAPLLDAVPYGAPVRFHLKLKNVSEASKRAPTRLGMKSGYVTGTLTDESGKVRRFSTVIRSEDEQSVGPLGQGESLTDSITLLRGPQGPLFPHSGLYYVHIRAVWPDGKSLVTATSDTIVRVTPPVDDDHRIAALRILNTPETLFSLAIGGDQFIKGNEAIDVALANDVLRPHFAVVHARRHARRGESRNSFATACRCLDKSCVLASGEIEALAKRFLKACEADESIKPHIQKVAQILKEKAEKLVKFRQIDADCPAQETAAKLFEKCGALEELACALSVSAKGELSSPIKASLLPKT